MHELILIAATVIVRVQNETLINCRVKSCCACFTGNVGRDLPTFKLMTLDVKEWYIASENWQMKVAHSAACGLPSSGHWHVVKVPSAS